MRTVGFGGRLFAFGLHGLRVGGVVLVLLHREAVLEVGYRARAFLMLGRRRRGCPGCGDFSCEPFLLLPAVADP